jgi:hypothetical protein
MVQWNSQWPIGNKSVKFNKDPGVQNTEYIETIMNLDHHWKDSTNTDGHHKWIQMPQQGTPATPTDAPLATGMDGVIFAKATDALNTYQDVQPFFMNNADIGTPGITNLMQMLGMRACGVFLGRSSNGNCTLNYSHNISTISRGGSGEYTITYTNPLPSANYLVFSGMTSEISGLLRMRQFTSSMSEVKTATFCKLICEFRTDFQQFDPYQGWFFCFGG